VGSDWKDALEGLFLFRKAFFEPSRAQSWIGLDLNNSFFSFSFIHALLGFQSLIAWNKSWPLQKRGEKQSILFPSLWGLLLFGKHCLSFGLNENKPAFLFLRRRILCKKCLCIILHCGACSTESPKLMTNTRTDSLSSTETPFLKRRSHFQTRTLVLLRNAKTRILFEWRVEWRGLNKKRRRICSCIVNCLF